MNLLRFLKEKLLDFYLHLDICITHNEDFKFVSINYNNSQDMQIISPWFKYGVCVSSMLLCMDMVEHNIIIDKALIPMI